MEKPMFRVVNLGSLVLMLRTIVHYKWNLWHFAFINLIYNNCSITHILFKPRFVHRSVHYIFCTYSALSVFSCWFLAWLSCIWLLISPMEDWNFADSSWRFASSAFVRLSHSSYHANIQGLFYLNGFSKMYINGKLFATQALSQTQNRARNLLMR